VGDLQVRRLPGFMIDLGDQLTLQEIERVQIEETGDLNLLAAGRVLERLRRYSMSFLTFRFKVPDALFNVRIN